MNIPMPAGFEPPPEAEVGGEFDAVLRVRLEEDGTLTALTLDGAELTESEEVEETETVEEVEESPMPADGAQNMMKRYGKMMKKA